MSGTGAVLSPAAVSGVRAEPPARPASAAGLRRATPAEVAGFAIMVLGMFMALLDIQIVAASLQPIAGGLSASRDEITWVQTSYLVAEIVMIPLSGWLSRALSTRWLYTIAAVGFTLASVACGLAWTITSIVVFRAIQGFFGGALIPLVFSTAFILFPGRRRAAASAIIGLIATIAPTFGPTLGGWITEAWSWRWLFFINVLPGMAIAIFVPLLLRFDRPQWRLLRQVDGWGVLALAIFLAGLQYVLEEGPRHDWFGDRSVRTLAWAAGGAAVIFFWRSFTARFPVVDLRSLADRNFALGCTFSFVLGLGLFGAVYLTPVYLAEVRGYSSLQIGLAVMTTGLFQFLSVPIAAGLARVVDLRLMLAFGFAAFAWGLYLLTPVTADWGWRELFWPQAVRGFALMFCILPANSLALGGLPADRLKVAAGLYNLMRTLGGAIGIALSLTMLTQRTNLHFFRMAETLTAADPALQAALPRLAERFMERGMEAAAAEHAALQHLRDVALREANVQTFSDIFLLGALVFAATALLTPFVRRFSLNAPAETATAE